MFDSNAASRDAKGLSCIIHAGFFEGTETSPQRSRHQTMGLVNNPNKLGDLGVQFPTH